jgi:hypothetical protein
MKKTYYYILTTQEMLFKNQVLEELLREKSNNYQINKLQRDFWILNSPYFINKFKLLDQISLTNFYKDNKNKLNYLCSIVSCDKKYIQWIQLRLGYFENINNFKSNNYNERYYTSDGIFGSFEIENENILFENKLKINPNFISKEYEYIINKI